MPLTAFLGRFFGQKRVYLFSLVLFVLGSALCGLARSLPMLVACRALQGLGAGALQPTEQAILRQTFPPEEQGMAMALFGLAVMVGPAVGPDAGRLHRRQLRAGRGSSTSTCRSACSASSW